MDKAITDFAADLADTRPTVDDGVIEAIAAMRAEISVPEHSRDEAAENVVYRQAILRRALSVLKGK